MYIDSILLPILSIIRLIWFNMVTRDGNGTIYISVLGTTFQDLKSYFILPPGPHVWAALHVFKCG